MCRRTVITLAWIALGIACGLTACEGCHAPGASVPTVSSDLPTIRLYAASDIAGALEPCGCVKDQLGGVDHLAAWMQGERVRAPASALVAAGPVFFMDTNLSAERETQEVLKAHTLANALRRMGLTAFAPGINDMSAGKDELVRLVAMGGAPCLGMDGLSPWKNTRVLDVNGIRIGMVGVGGVLPQNVGAPSPDAVVRKAASELRREKANILIALVAVGRGEAKRIADAVPDLTAVVVGSPSSQGDVNQEAPALERVGDVVIVQSGSHVTSVAVLDLYVREGSFHFVDGTGAETARKRDELTKRIDELHAKIASWEKDPAIAPSDLDARRSDLVKLEGERVALKVPSATPSGSHFRYFVKEVREPLGSDAAVKSELSRFYKEVNEHNRVAFANKLPQAAGPNQPSYIGVEACSSCHIEPREVWDKTAHAHAYATLSDQSKEFNLDCVSCHVTGYDLPGGSTVTHAEKLQNVQCEVCHGPGSKHAAMPEKVKPPISKPGADTCLSCHHPPHVHEFDAKAKMDAILGPGHGRSN